MDFYSKITIDIETSEVLDRVVCIKDYTGPVELSKGSSDSERQLSEQQNNFYGTLRNNYNQQFSGQQAILSSLTSAFSPILSAGPGQFGYTPQEEGALRTQADEGTAHSYQNARAAAGQALAAQGGGNEFLPSSTKAGIMARIANQAAAQQSSQQLGITQSGYDVGRNNFFGASSALAGAAGLMNPLGYAGQATTAGNSAFGSADTILQQDQAAKQAMWGTIGGVAGSLLGPLGGALGSKLAGSFAGGVPNTGGA